MAITVAVQDCLRNAKVDTKEEIPQEYWNLIDQYRTKLVEQAVAILGNIEDAEDVVQETFCEVFRSGTRLTQVRSVGAWLRAINRGNALNRLRDDRRDDSKNERRRQQLGQDEFTTGGLSAVEICETVTQALESLPIELRKVVVLRYWQHLSYKEIAQRLNLPAGTIGRLLYNATMQLYEKLKREDMETGRPPSSADLKTGSQSSIIGEKL
ncbi:MAG: RNA polymerase sigma factor [Planctomycetota bacterium]